MTGSSFPLRERGLKLPVRAVDHYLEGSFPLRERGLKLPVRAVDHYLEGSFPLRERGLKLQRVWHILRDTPVVPLAGTWIETSRSPGSNCDCIVVPLAGTWIETMHQTGFYGMAGSRSPCGNVD